MSGVVDLAAERDSRAVIAELVNALRIGEQVESLFLDLTGDGRMDCRSDASIDLCEAFQRFQDARIAALKKAGVK